MSASMCLYNHSLECCHAILYLSLILSVSLSGLRAMLRSESIPILTCVKSFVPSIIYSLSGTSLHSLESSTTPAAEDSHNSKAYVEQCQRVCNQAPHFRHPAHAAEHART